MHRDQYVSDGSEYAGLHLEYTESVECYDRPGLVELAQDDPAPDDPAYYAPTLDALWNAFGEERLVYAGNWPVSWRYGEYAQVQKLATTYFEQKGVEVLEKVMWKNSQTAYGWGGGGERKW
ncbi:MAG: amidohydrolase family protein [Gemmatimonadota bacterium]|nr:amidohydrolase family protein [Gemmatimonadota bacterium]